MYFFSHFSKIHDISGNNFPHVPDYLASPPQYAYLCDHFGGEPHPLFNNTSFSVILKEPTGCNSVPSLCYNSLDL